MNLYDLCMEIAVSGYEKKLSDKIKNNFGDIDENIIVETDLVNNIIVHKNKKKQKKKVLLMAHMDEVGFQIKSQISCNRYRFKKMGGIDLSLINNNKMLFENGNIGYIQSEKEDVTQKEKLSINDLYIEVFGNNETNIGDVFTFYPIYLSNDGFVKCKALDNRVGCSILYELICENLNSNLDVYFAFTVQEEIGMRGAKTVINRIIPDVIISVDVAPEGQFSSIAVGNGVGIKLSDGVSVSNGELVNEFINIAETNKIQYQIEVSDYGTTEIAVISEIYMDVQNIAISIPCKDMHTSKTCISQNDFNNALDLLRQFLLC